MYIYIYIYDDAERGNFPCGKGNCEICNILKPAKQFKSTLTGEIYKTNFHFDCNSLCVVYLITCKVCKKQYTGSTVTKFRARFNQYKSNLKLYGEGRRGFFQEKLIEHFLNHGHNGSYKDMMVEIIDFCDPNDQEKREGFWMEHHSGRSFSLSRGLSQFTTIPKVLQIKKTPCIRNTDDIFTETWKNTLRNAEMALMHQLKEKDKAIYSQLHNEFFTHITKSLDDSFEISDIRDLVQFFVEEENQLFNHRITTFVKVSEQQHKLQDLRNHMLITEPLSSELHSLYLLHAEKLQHVASRKKQSTKHPETIVEDQEELLDHENAPSTQNTSLSNDKTLLNVLEGLLADNIEPQQPIDLQFRQSLGESSNSQLKSNTNGNKKERMEGKFVSKNVLNLSNRVLTESEIRVLDKGLNFVPTPEKLDRYQIKKDLERLGRDIILKIDYKTEPTPAFSEKPAFKVPSNWPPPI